MDALKTAPQKPMDFQFTEGSQVYRGTEGKNSLWKRHEAEKDYCLLTKAALWSVSSDKGEDPGTNEVTQPP